MRGDQVQTNPSYWHFYLSVFFPHLPLPNSLCVCVFVCVGDGESGWDTGRATEDFSTYNCSSPVSFLPPHYPFLLWSSHIASNPLLLFCFGGKKETNLSNKNNEGVFSADVRCQGDSQEAGAICQAQTKHWWQSCPAAGCIEGSQAKSTSVRSLSWALWLKAETDALRLWIRQGGGLLTHSDY